MKGLVKCLTTMATHTEKTGRQFGAEMKVKFASEQQVYFRLIVQHGLENVGSEEWNEMVRTQIATARYLGCQRKEIERSVSQIACT